MNFIDEKEYLGDDYKYLYNEKGGPDNIKNIEGATSLVRKSSEDHFQDESEGVSPKRFNPKIELVKKQHFVGTAEYMAPEILTNQEIGPYTDLWSLGCCIYQMFMGSPPFVGKTDYLIFQNVMNLNFKIDKKIIPEDALDLIQKLLVINPKDRLGSGFGVNNTLDDLKKHKFFHNFDSSKYVEILQQYLQKTKNTQKRREDSIFQKIALSQSEKIYINDEDIYTEKILKMGILKKKSPWFYYDKRKIILFNSPRIDYFEPYTNVLKGTILLDKSCQAKLVDKIKFELVTPNRTYTFMCKKKFEISPWVQAINEAIEKFAK